MQTAPFLPSVSMTEKERRDVIIQSHVDRFRFYTGLTRDVAKRVKWHNHGPCGYTMANRPWSLVASMQLASESAARQFERYLKSGSGRALLRAISLRTKMTNARSQFLLGG
jgi:putative endonuclease